MKYVWIKGSLSYVFLTEVRFSELELPLGCSGERDCELVLYPVSTSIIHQFLLNNKQ